MSDGLQHAVATYRQDGMMCRYNLLATIAEAYVVHLDEQAELNVPYDWEWLAARPEFKSKPYGVLAAFKSSGIFVFVHKATGKWVMGNGTTGPMSIPAPATKADVIKLLEVFS